MSEEKTKTALLREELMNEPKDAKSLSAETIAEADSFCEGYKAFLNDAPVEREAVSFTLNAAEKAGFTAFDPNASYKCGDRVYLVNRDKAVALAVIGKNGVKNGARLAIAHIDSPQPALRGEQPCSLQNPLLRWAEKIPVDGYSAQSARSRRQA